MGFKCILEFDRDPAVYTAGESITGRIKLFPSHTPVKLYELELSLVGVIRPWPKYGGMGCYRRYPRIRIPWPILCGAKKYCTFSFCKGKDYCITIQGTEPMSFPFKMELPTNAFSSHVCHEGYSMYKIMLSGRSGAPAPAGAEGMISFDTMVLLVGRMPKLRRGYEIEYKQSSEWTNPTNSAQKVSLNITLEGRCATGGDVIRFSLHGENGMRSPLGSLKCILQQETSWTFTTSGGKSEAKDTKIIATKDGPSVPPGPGRKLEWTGELALPHIIPSGKGETASGSFKLAYKLIFIVTSSLVNVRVPVPIHVGTAEEGADGESLELSYFSGIRRSLSATSLDALSISSDDSGCWLSMDEISSMPTNEGEGGGS